MFPISKTKDWGDEEDFPPSPPTEKKENSQRVEGEQVKSSVWGDLEAKTSKNKKWEMDDPEASPSLWPSIQEDNSQRSQDNLKNANVKDASLSTSHPRNYKYNKSGTSDRSSSSDTRYGRYGDQMEEHPRHGSYYERRNPRDYQEHSSYGRKGRASFDRRNNGDYDRRNHGDYDYQYKNQHQQQHQQHSGNDRWRRQPDEVEISSEKETGIISKLKDSFGFLTCADREGDLFFHFSEAPEDIQVGDEVEFQTTPNERAGKYRAVRLKVLPKGTIQLVEISEERYKGKVHKGIVRGKGDSNSSNVNSFYDSSRYSSSMGLIEVEVDGKTSFVSFSAEDVRGNTMVPRYCDEIEFNIAVNKKNKKKRAVDIILIRTARDVEIDHIMMDLEKSHTREMGIVASLRESSGLIACCNRKNNIFFHLSQLEESESDSTKKNIAQGDCVSFFVHENLWSNRGREPGVENVCAWKVKLLPSGSVTLTETIETGVEGLIVKEPRDGRMEEKTGKIRREGVVTENEAVGDESTVMVKSKENFFFSLVDLQDKNYVPIEGDLVRFNVVLNKRTQRHHAAEIVVVALNEATRETGKVSAAKESYGFITCCDRPNDAYFRFSDYVGEVPLHEGAEVSFNIYTDSKQSKAKGVPVYRASRIKILPHGTIAWKKVLVEGIEGTIVSVPPRTSRGFHRRNGPAATGNIKFFCEKLTLDLFEDLEKTVVGFLNDSEEKELIFSTSSLSSIQQEIVRQWSNRVNNGRIICSVDQEDGKKMKLVKTTATTTTTCTTTTGTTTGTTTTPGDHKKEEETRKDDDDDDEEKENDEEKSEEKKVVIDDSPSSFVSVFSYDDIDDPRYQPHVGDVVKFDLMMDKRTKQCHCVNVNLVSSRKDLASARKDDIVSGDLASSSSSSSSSSVVEEGVVSSIVKDSAFGFIQSTTRSEPLFFHMCQLKGDYSVDNAHGSSAGTSGSLKKRHVKKLLVGDEVKFTVSMNTRKKKLNAVDIEVLKPGTLSLYEEQKERRKGMVIVESKLNSKSRPGKIEELLDLDENETTMETFVEECENVEDEEKMVVLKKNTEVSNRMKELKKKEFIYTNEDCLESDMSLRIGDIVEFSVMLSKIVARKSRAVEITLVRRNVVETGYVHELTKRGGIIVKGECRSKITSVRDTLEAHRQGNHGKDVEKQSEMDEPLEENQIGFEHGSVVDNSTLKCGDKVEYVVMTSPRSKKVHAFSIRRKHEESSTSQHPETRVNSDLMKAMRQNGTTWTTASRMAKGPDGTTGFAGGWRKEVVNLPDNKK